MKERYTQQDVQRLVGIVESIDHSVQEAGQAVVHNTSDFYKKMLEALAPFRPDPEEILLDLMCEAMEKADRESFNLPSIRTITRHQARAALDVIKEKGYFNDQR